MRYVFLSPEEEHEFIASLAEKHRSRGLQRMSPIFRDMKLQPNAKLILFSAESISVSAVVRSVIGT